MQKKYRFVILVQLLISTCALPLNAQELAGGKWYVCTSYSFSSSYQCTNHYTAYEFFDDGTYREDRQPIYNGIQLSFVPGQWILSGNSLTMDENDVPNVMIPVKELTIDWINKDTFYVTGREGKKGPVVYTYFQRRE